MCSDSDVHKSRHFLELYVIVDDGLLGSTDLAPLAEQVIRGGADAIQYRAKNLPKRQYHENALLLLKLTRDSNVRFFVNDYLDVALAISADGIHLGQNDLPCAIARQMVPRDMILGTSTHSVEEASRAVVDGADYVAIGSVFPTSTKQNPEAIVGTKMIREVKDTIGSVPLIAIGGITAANIASVIRSGADGVAVASAAVLADDVAGAVRDLKRAILAARAT